MTFFNLSDGKPIKPTTTYKEDNFEPIPDNTFCTASIEAIGFNDYQGDRYIEARFTILTGEYQGRKIFHKFRVYDIDEKKNDRAKKMLLSVDTICGGSLYDLTVHGKDFNTFDLTRLQDKPMTILLRTWEMNGNRGNFIAGIEAVSGNYIDPSKTVNMDDDIPF